MGGLRAHLTASAPPTAACAAQCFTKWCPQPRAYTTAEVAAALDRSCSRIQTPTLDLLQLHWWGACVCGAGGPRRSRAGGERRVSPLSLSPLGATPPTRPPRPADYAARAELQNVLLALHAAKQAGRIRELGLTNFDTAHVVWMTDTLQLPIVSNQVQFSLVDARPLARMAPACEARGVKLLTYGTLLGGLLTDAWLGRPAPAKQALDTPSKGKYFNMIQQWGGWGLFQALLAAARSVADRHAGASIATVAIAWVLRQQAVGGVIVGLRAGLSEHSAENARAVALAEALTAADLAQLLAASRAGRDLLAVIGDCGDEYRG